MRVLALAMAILIGGPVAAADRTIVVKFAKGATAADLRGAIHGAEGIVYRIATAPGQAMQVLFAPRNRSCYMNVYAPGAEIGRDAAAFVGSTSGNEFSMNPAAVGSYQAQVYLMRNAARRGETCRFTLSIEITGAPGGVSAGLSDRMLVDACKGAAAPLYGVEPRHVIVPRKIVARGEGFGIDGTVDKGRDGVKKLRCLFRADRQFSHIQAMTRDGE